MHDFKRVFFLAFLTTFLLLLINLFYPIRNWDVSYLLQISQTNILLIVGVVFLVSFVFKIRGFVNLFKTNTDPDLVVSIRLPTGAIGPINPVGSPRLFLFKNKMSINEFYFSGEIIAPPFELDYINIKNIQFKKNWNHWFKYRMTILTDSQNKYKVDGILNQDKEKIENVMQTYAPNTVVETV